MGRGVTAVDVGRLGEGLRGCTLRPQGGLSEAPCCPSYIFEPACVVYFFIDVLVDSGVCVPALRVRRGLCTAWKPSRYWQTSHSAVCLTKNLVLHIAAGPAWSVFPPSGSSALPRSATSATRAPCSCGRSVSSHPLPPSNWDADRRLTREGNKHSLYHYNAVVCTGESRHPFGSR